VTGYVAIRLWRDEGRLGSRAEGSAGNIITDQTGYESFVHENVVYKVRVTNVLPTHGDRRWIVLVRLRYCMLTMVVVMMVCGTHNLLISHGAQNTGHNAHLLPPAGHQDTTHSALTHTDQCE